MGVFFTSDNHFGHTNIIEYCQRPFKTAKEMDDAMIENWNAVVGVNDTIFHLGDFTLGRYTEALSYFKRLNGKIHMLTNTWHHDRYWLKELENRWSALWFEDIVFVPPMYVTGNNPPIVLCHYPLAVWDRKHYGSWHLHGHSHGRYKGEGFVMDVGVDANEFTPVRLETVKKYMEALDE